MTLACICGGLIEFIIFAIVSIVGPIIGTTYYNYRQKKKCGCECHPEHKEC